MTAKLRELQELLRADNEAARGLPGSDWHDHFKRARASFTKSAAKLKAACAKKVGVELTLAVGALFRVRYVWRTLHGRPCPVAVLTTCTDATRFNHSEDLPSWGDITATLQSPAQVREWLAQYDPSTTALSDATAARVAEDMSHAAWRPDVRWATESTRAWLLPLSDRNAYCPPPPFLHRLSASLGPAWRRA